MKKLRQQLQVVANENYQSKVTEFSRGGTLSKRPICRMLDLRLSICRRDEDLDHCHYSGVFLGYAHNQCNSKRRSFNYVPVIANNFSNYDIHHLCKNLHEFDSECRLDIIPLTAEKHVTLSIGIKVNSLSDRRGISKNVYENLRTTDSYRFLPSSWINWLATCHQKVSSFLIVTAVKTSPLRKSFGIRRDNIPTHTLPISIILQRENCRQ